MPKGHKVKQDTKLPVLWGLLLLSGAFVLPLYFFPPFVEENNKTKGPSIEQLEQEIAELELEEEELKRAQGRDTRVGESKKFGFERAEEGGMLDLDVSGWLDNLLDFLGANTLAGQAFNKTAEVVDPDGQVTGPIKNEIDEAGEQIAELFE